MRFNDIVTQCVGNYLLRICIYERISTNIDVHNLCTTLNEIYNISKYFKNMEKII